MKRVTHRCSTLITLAIVCLVGAAPRAKAEESIRLPQSFYGYYVYASEKNDGSNCNKNEPTPNSELERNPEDPRDHIGFQMEITASAIRYDGIGTHVSCEINRIYRPEKKRVAPNESKFLGSWLRPFDPVYVLDLACRDEGETSRFSEMFRTIRLGSSIVLLETNKFLVTDAWAKCQRQ
jgi:hypothetical protein